MADIAREMGISRFVLMSANGVEARQTPYQTTKHDAERYVADAGFDVTIADKQGFTALHWAAIRNRREMCDLLLEGGADPAIEDLTVHQTPAGWARHDGHDPLAAHLQARVSRRSG